MKENLLILILLTISLSGYCQNNIRIEKADCFLEECEAFADYPNVEFGFICVPEDYNKPDGKFIKVAFSIVKSTVEIPETDPILIFGGGWGMPVVFQTMAFLSTMPIKNRDIILYDYRGSGYSTPNLCPDLGKKQWELIQQDLKYDEFTAKLNSQFYTCFEELEQQGIDYRLYGTEIKTIDAVKLIEQLGYKEVNLFGISNGTMSIQGFLRAAENSSVKIRSIYSDSNVPMRDYLSGDFTLRYKQILDQILDVCANDPECENAYPNLKERYHKFIRESLNKPLTYKGEKVLIFNTYEINGVIHQLLYSSSNFKDLPLVLEALMNDELSFIDQLLFRFQKLVERANGTSIINYTHDWKARHTAVKTEYEQVQQDYPEFMWADFWLDFYVNDTTIKYNPRDTIPVTSDIPALVIAGSYDLITAPKYSKMMHRRYSNSYYFELPKVGHGVFFTPCGNQILEDFIENPEIRPNDECVKTLESVPINFTTSLYKNTKLSRLFLEVGFQRNVLWISVLVIPMLFCLLLFIREIFQALRKKAFNALRFIQSVCVLIFLFGLSYYSFETIQQGGLTLFFGLVEAAWWLPWLCIVILVLGLNILYQMTRTSKFNFWNVGLILSSILVIITAFTYGIKPF
ncbi:alpha/beta hydrolase [Aquiflexum lacus]|uniref:alpha/beta hydrolase n=1 Tax=Aquiflexum lacus TaxID=2483805 RepID=UPI00189317D7|nr:alpha/beta hydrolase [Aquiflexum lacus]